MVRISSTHTSALTTSLEDQIGYYAPTLHAILYAKYLD